MIEIVIISAAMAFAVVAAHLDHRDQQRQDESFRSALERLRQQYSDDRVWERDRP